VPPPPDPALIEPGLLRPAMHSPHDLNPAAKPRPAEPMPRFASCPLVVDRVAQSLPAMPISPQKRWPSRSPQHSSYRQSCSEMSIGSRQVVNADSPPVPVPHLAQPLI